MSETIAQGDYIQDFMKQLSEIIPKIQDAELAAQDMEKLMQTEMYQGEASGDLSLFTKNLSSSMTRLREFYNTGFLYLYRYMLEMNYTDEQLHAILNQIGEDK